MEDIEIEEEIDKVERRVPHWKQNPTQINSRILSLFMQLSDNGENGVFLDMLRDEFETLYPEESNIFDRNYNQMKNFGSHNHAKVFEEDEEYTVRLWYPVRDIIRELYSY